MSSTADNITVHMQVFKNQRAVEECVKRFRAHFPNSKFVLQGDAGVNYQYLAHQYNLDYIHWDKQVPPIFINGSWRDYLKRLLTTCERHPNEWLLLMEEDVNTLHGNIKFPVNDFNGTIGQAFSQEFTSYIKTYFPEKLHVRYNTSGGSLIKMDALVYSINSILSKSIDIELINTLDPRILKFLDTLLSAILHLHGFTFGVWDQLSEVSSNINVPDAVFDHSWKEFYDMEEYVGYRKRDNLTE